METTQEGRIEEHKADKKVWFGKGDEAREDSWTERLDSGGSEECDVDRLDSCCASILAWRIQDLEKGWWRDAEGLYTWEMEGLLRVHVLRLIYKWQERSLSLLDPRDKTREGRGWAETSRVESGVGTSDEREVGAWGRHQQVESRQQACEKAYVEMDTEEWQADTKAKGQVLIGTDTDQQTCVQSWSLLQKSAPKSVLVRSFKRIKRLLIAIVYRAICRGRKRQCNCFGVATHLM